MHNSEDIPAIDNKVMVCLHPPLNNTQLTKDPGIILYIMGRDFGYESFIVSYKNGDYPDLHTETKGLHHIILKKGILYPIFHSIPDRVAFLWKNSSRIDVLMLFQFSIPSLISGAVYKFLNPKGQIYIKLDKDFEKSISTNIGINEFLLFSKICHYDLISVESEEALYFLHNHPQLVKYREDFHYIPNGLDIKRLSHFGWKWDNKEDLILCSGSKSKQKAVELAVAAFDSLITEFPGWRLEFVGNLSKIDYYKKLRKAKIFISPSRWESFGFMQFEAAFFGNVILGSDLVAMKQATSYGAFGELCPVDDLDCFKGKLRYLMSHPQTLKMKSLLISEHVSKNYDCHNTCKKLQSLLLKDSGKAYK